MWLPGQTAAHPRGRKRERHIQKGVLCAPACLFQRHLLCFGPQVQIQTKKMDISHVTSKCGSMSNIHHRPGTSAQQPVALNKSCLLENPSGLCGHHGNWALPTSRGSNCASCRQVEVTCASRTPSWTLKIRLTPRWAPCPTSATPPEEGTSW